MIYLDNSATTRQYPEVTREMLRYMDEIYGNPSSLYQLFFHYLFDFVYGHYRSGFIVHMHHRYEDSFIVDSRSQRIDIESAA